MMPIRMRGNCRLRYEHDKLPPPWRGPSSEARHGEVTPSLRVRSAADLDCSHSLRRGTGVGGTGPGDPGTRGPGDPGQRRFVTSTKPLCRWRQRCLAHKKKPNNKTLDCAAG